MYSSMYMVDRDLGLIIVYIYHILNITFDIFVRLCSFVFVTSNNRKNKYVSRFRSIILKIGTKFTEKYTRVIFKLRVNKIMHHFSYAIDL